MKSNFWKKTAAGLMALLIVAGGMPVKPVVDLIGDTAITANAVEAVTYIGEDGTVQTCDDYTVLTGAETGTLSAGWYLVNSNITYSHTLTFEGDDVHIILADGCTMNIGTEQNKVSGYGISSWGNAWDKGALFIHGQSENTGTLNIYTTGSSYSCLRLKAKYNQYGGTVNLNSAGDGIFSNGYIDIYGGTFNVDSGESALHFGGTIYFHGGNSHIVGSQKGIYASNNGGITFGLQSADDSVYFSSLYAKDIRIQDGCTLTDGTNIYDSSTSTATLKTLNNTTLVPYLGSYNITVSESIEHGSITVPETAIAGDTVPLTVTPEAGYVLKSLTVKDASNQEVAVTDDQFTMPFGNVTVSAEFGILYSAVIDSNIENGTIESDKKAYFEGDTVTLTVTPNTGYNLKSIKVMQGETEIPVTGNQFTMPAGDVTVSAEFGILYSAAIDANIKNGTIGSDKAAYIEGDTVTLTVTPNTGYKLKSIKVMQGETEIPVTGDQFTMPAGDVTVSAEFALAFISPVTPQLDSDGFYSISSAEELYGFAALVNSGNANLNGKLTADIVVNENVLDANGNANMDDFVQWTPIGKDEYAGIFDGQGHTISGLYYSGNSNFIGLIGQVEGNAVVKNLGIVDSYFSSSGGYIGSIVGYINKGSSLTLANVYSTSTVKGDNFVGGLAGGNGYGLVNIINSYFAGKTSSEFLSGKYGEHHDDLVAGYFNSSTKATLNVVNTFVLGTSLYGTSVTEEQMSNGTVAAALHYYHDSLADGSMFGLSNGRTGFYSKLDGVSLTTANITLHILDDETTEYSPKYIVGNITPLPVNVELKGYIFLGWYDNADFEGDAVTSIPSSATGNKEYWAKLQKGHKVSFVSNGGITNNGIIDRYAEGEVTALPTIVQKSGASFEGWYTTEDFTGSRYYYIPATATEDMTFYAKWGEEKTEIYLYSSGTQVELFYEGENIVYLETGDYYLGNRSYRYWRSSASSVNIPYTGSGSILNSNGTKISVPKSGFYVFTLEDNGNGTWFVSALYPLQFNCTVSDAPIPDQIYNGSAFKPAIDIETELKLGRDYVVEYSDNTYAGTAKITIKGIGNYGGTIEKTFVIKSNITISESTGHGTVETDKLCANEGETVTLTITPDEGYAVKSVTVNGKEIDPVDGVYSFTMPAGVASVRVEYTEFDGKCGDNAYWEYNEATGTLSITGEGALYSYNNTSSPAPWAVFSDDITSIDIAPGITAIGSYAFSNCDQITSITLPDSLTSIRAHAFYRCTSLLNITCNADPSVLSIGKAFVSTNVNFHVPYEYYSAYVDKFSISNVTFVADKYSYYDYDYVGKILYIGGEVTADGINNYLSGIGVQKSEVLRIVALSGTKLPADSSYLFRDFTNVSRIELYGADASNVTNMAGMFYGCKDLEQLDLNGFDTSKVTNMSGMFYNCSNLKTITVDSSWTTVNVMSSSEMFSGCGVLSGGNGTVSNTIVDKTYAQIDGKGGKPGYLTAKTTYSLDMLDCFTIVLDSDERISGTNNYLPGATLLIKYVPVENHTVENIRLNEEELMLNDGFCTIRMDRDICITADIIPLQYYDFETHTLFLGGNVTKDNIDDALAGCYKSDVERIVANPGTKLPADCSDLFFNFDNVTSIDLENADTSGVRNMAYMFNGLGALTELDLSSFNTTNVKDMSYMFSGCEELTEIDLSSFSTSNVTDMNNMFSGCKTLESLDLSKLNTSNVDDMSYMFDGCSNLTFLDLSGLNTTKVTDMSGMFRGCTELGSVDLSSFNTARVKYMLEMFSECTSLASLDISSFDTKNVKNMTAMFNSCENLEAITVDTSWTVDNVTLSDAMFMDCSSLVGSNGTAFDSGITDKTYARIDGRGGNPGYLTAKRTYTLTYPDCFEIATDSADRILDTNEYLPGAAVVLRYKPAENVVAKGFTANGEPLAVNNGLSVVTMNRNVSIDADLTELTYGEPSWTWSEDHNSVSAAFKCDQNDEVKTVKADVTISASEPDESGNVTVTYTAVADFNGTEYTDTYTERVALTDISAARLTVDSIAIPYDGNEHKVNAVLRLNDGTVLREGVDYTVSGDTATEKGTYTLTVEGIGEYSGKVYAVWKISEAYCVTANTGNGIVRTTYDEKTSATVKAANVEGKKFKCWQSDGKILSFSKNYSFIVLRDIELEAVYVDESEEVIPEPVVDFTASKQIYDGKNAFKFIFDRSIDDRYSVVEAGIAYTANKTAGYTTDSTVNLTKTDFDFDAVFADSTKFRTYTPKGINSNNGTIAFNLIIEYCVDNYYYAKGYVTLIDKVTGKSMTVYTNLIAIKYNA